MTLPTFDRQTLIEALARIVTPGIKLTALADELGARKPDYAALRELLFELVEEGVALVLPGGAFALAPSGRAPDAKSKRRGKPTLPWARPAAADAAPTPRVSTTASTRPRIPTSVRSAPGARAGAPTGPSPSPGAIVRPPLRPPVVAPPPPVKADDGRVYGKITVHPAGYGFVATDEGETVFVPAKYRATSLDGDRVALTTWPGVKGTEGRVAEVLARGRARLTGVLRRVARAVYLEPDDPRIATDYGRVQLDEGALGADGDAVVVEITRYPDAARPELVARVLKVLGDPEDPRTEIEKILACASIPGEFPEDALRQAEGTAPELTPADLADRIDLRDRRFATIDPETARDFDDALCIEDGPHGGPRVWVAVADVSHYVRWGDALDKEATIRSVSVYLPDRVISMLPHQLSAGICSLNPLVDRCAMVVRLDYTDDGDLVDVSHAAAVIRSKGRLDYPGVAAALAGDFRGRRADYKPWLAELTRLDALAQKLRVRRRARGALDLELAEPKVILDADDPLLVRDVVKAKGDPAVKQAYQLVEEYMIAANEAVGAYFRKRNATTVWRVHAPPAEDRVKLLAEVMGAFGIKVDVIAARTPLGMKLVLDQINERPGAQALSFLVLRTLTQAVWDTVPIGHFGLASGDYLHFTSPIRRYPDLLVHRLLKYHLHRDGNPSGGGYEAPPPPVETLTELAASSSAHERRAMEAERESVAMYRAYIMRDRVGEHFHGVVSAVTSFGAFVELESPYVEGLLKLEALGDEGFNYDQVHMRLSGKRTGKTIELGDKVEVEILNVSVLRRRIEFGLVAATHGIARTPVADNPRIGLGAKRKAGREVEQAARGGASAATPRRSGDGKLRLKVSHRGSGPSGRDDRGGRPSGGGGGGKPAKGGKGGKAGGKRGGRR